MTDFIYPGKHDKIKKMYNPATTAILIEAVTAFIIELLAFVQKLSLFL